MVDTNNSADISVRHFPGEEEPTPATAWVSLATVLIFFAAAILYSLHIAAPDAEEEYTAFIKAHPPDTAEGELAAAQFCSRRPALFDRYERHLRYAWKADRELPALKEELQSVYERRRDASTGAADHDAVAGWCREFGMNEEAEKEYQAALLLDASDAEAKKGLQEMRK